MRRGRTQPKSALDQIKQEIDKQNDEDVQEFSFNKIAIGQFSNEIVQHLLKFTSIISLEFNNCSLKTLQGFVGFKKIIKLCFEENELEGDSLKFIAENFPELQFLSLSHNKIEKIEDLQPLKQLKQLTQLDLQDNPVSKNANYRSTIFDLCEKLEILDNKDKDGNEVQYSDSEQEEEEDDEDSDENYTQDEEEEDDEEDLSDDDEEDRRRKKRTKK